MKTQLIRGLIGLALLTAAGFAYNYHLVLSIFLVLLSVIPLRGCPVCWTVETCEIARNTSRDKDKDKVPPLS